MSFKSPGLRLASGRLIEGVYNLDYTNGLVAKMVTAFASLPDFMGNSRGDQGNDARQTAVDAGTRYVIGVFETLRDWRDSGKSPTEIHQPGVGLWVRRLDTGWEMVYAELALGVQFDLALSAASIEVTFFSEWYAAMRAKLAAGRSFRAGSAGFSDNAWATSGYSRPDYGSDVMIAGLGRIGGGGAPIAELFWTRHVLSREAIP